MKNLRPLLAAGVLALSGAAGAARADARDAARDAAIGPTVLVVDPRSGGPRLAQDSAEVLYRSATDAFSRGDYRRAARLFEQVATRYPKSAHRSDALYWHAFSLYREGDTADLRQARTVLAGLRSADVASYRRGGASLDTRICGELARRGDAQCAATVEQRADSGDIAVAVRGLAQAVTSMAADAARLAGEATANALRDPEVSAAIASATDAARVGMSEGMRAAGEAIRDASAGLRDGERAIRDAERSARGGRTGRSQPSGCETDDDDVQVIALNALLQMDAERAMPLLKKVMAKRDRCSEVLRKKAVFLISQKRSPESADLLLDAARNDPDPDVRKEAVFWLSRVSGERSIGFLRDLALRGGDAELRKQAVFSLSQSGSPAARETLRQLAGSRDTDAEVRAEAIQWLGMRGNAEDAEFLRTLYPRLESRDLKDKALFAVSRRKANAGWLLDVAGDAREPIELRKQALFWAGQGGVAAEQLVALYDRATDREMKKQLVFVYQQRGTGAAFEKLLDIARTEKDAELRKDAIFWLSRSKDPRALRLIEEIISK